MCEVKEVQKEEEGGREGKYFSIITGIDKNNTRLRFSYSSSSWWVVDVGRFVQEREKKKNK